MKDKVQIALLSVIAIALVALAVAQFSGKGGAAGANTVAAGPDGNITASTTIDPSKPAETFDPMANATPPVDNTPKTTVNFTQYEHDFGKIKQDSENKHIFKFTNTGKEPMIIETANGSCGCTVPNYPKAPIPPGGTGEIEVVYKPGKQENAQTKTVTVIANTEPKETTLRIKAEVAPGTGTKDPAAGDQSIQVGH